MFSSARQASTALPAEPHATQRLFQGARLSMTKYTRQRPVAGCWTLEAAAAAADCLLVACSAPGEGILLGEVFAALLAMPLVRMSSGKSCKSWCCHCKHIVQVSI